MGLQKPQKSKAPASVQPAGGWHNNATVADPCCIPVSVPPLLANGSGDSSSGPDATHHIMNPTAH